ncbi:hypothetical protein J1N35_021736 [Gossypium stocksii]|uniref:Aminotransferase-like plant mobile domain-containing protein n=1 Tax=Gossypium stocksii TaxID=47602 RepID=A0A9D3VF42_9ROSI|nr:hypothetical protein J1N35_021736 [Gossypium stocksii]
MSYLQLAGFGNVTLIQRFDLRANLISALIERWCTETPTFIMPHRECTITLVDVAMQLGLRVDGAVFLWMSYFTLNIATLIPQWVHVEAHIWCINTPVLNFSTVEWYNGDRVMRQFVCRQFVPIEPQQFVNVHVLGHGYRRRNQPMRELEDQHMTELNSEDQPLNTSEQWVDAFCDESQSSSYHSDISGSSSYHSDMSGSSLYHPDRGGSSSFHPKQPPISFDMFSNNMYSTPPQATFDSTADPPDVYSTPKRLPRQ